MINVTQSAQSAIKKQLQKRNQGLGIKIGVKTNGCSGLAYVLEFLDNQSPECQIFSYDDFVIAVEPKALPIIDDMTIDYVKKGLNEGFEFVNPRETSRCGCGESFSI